MSFKVVYGASNDLQRPYNLFFTFTRIIDVFKLYKYIDQSEVQRWSSLVNSSSRASIHYHTPMAQKIGLMFILLKTT